jgi:cytochrome c-type biogenesis protein CcmH
MIVPSRAHAVALACVAAAITAFALGLHALSGEGAFSRAPAVYAKSTDDATINDPVKREDLVRHLARNPRDGRAWVLLARRDFADERFSDAASAYEKALAASTKVAADPAIWCEYADALGMTQGGRLEGRPRELVMKALAMNAAHPKALEMAGSAAFEQKEYASAVSYWRQLFAQLPSRSAPHRELAAAIAQAEQRMAGAQ